MKDDLKIGLAASTIALGTYLAYRGISKTRLDLSQSNASVATENQGNFLLFSNFIRVLKLSKTCRENNSHTVFGTKFPKDKSEILGRG